MAILVEPGDAIEGLATKGMARDPARNLGRERANGPLQGLHRYKLVDNVLANIAKARPSTPPPARLDPTASIDPIDSLAAEVVVVWAENGQLTSGLGANSGRHQGNPWDCPCHSTAKITKGREATLNAIANRRAMMGAAQASFGVP